MYGVLIMLVVECLEDVGCGCEETSPYAATEQGHTKPTTGLVRGCKNGNATNLL
jgi:hypothetical protein